MRGAAEMFELIAGERRLRASQRAGLTLVPCVVRELSEAETLEVQIVENAQREDVNPMDEARALHRLRDQLSYDVAEIAERIGKSEAYVYNMLKLCGLPQEVQEMLYRGALSKGVSWELIRLKDPAQQEQAGRDLARPEWSDNLTTIGAAKKYIKDHFGEKAQVRARKASDAKDVNYKQPPRDYMSNWKYYLIRFDGRQFAKWKQIVNNRVDTVILSEAVEAVMIEVEARAKAA
jgi:ParB family chromosome partitioning protein